MGDTEIRLIELDDAAALAVHQARDADEFKRWEPSRPDDFYTPEGQRRRIEQLLAGYTRGERWPAVVVADGVVIGQVTVSTILGEPFRKGFLGYWIATPHQGQGHAGRAVELALRVMTDDLGLHRAEAHTQVANVASHVVLRKNGFVSYGIAHNHILIQGTWRDEIVWEKTLSD